MKQLKLLEEIFEAERVVKTADSIVGYNRESEVFAMRGISDFKGYELLDDAEWDIPTESLTAEELQAENTAMKLALAEMAETLQKEKQEMQLALAEIAELIAGGVTNG